MNILAKRISTVLALLACQAALSGLVQAQQPRSISDCRAIEGELARYACYESLEAPADGTAAPAAAVPAAPAAAVTPPRPVSNLPVVRRPATEIGDLTGQNAQQQAPAAGTAEVRQQEDKPGLLRRLLPFGGDDDVDEPAAVATAEAAPPPAATTGDTAVDSFGRRGSGAARVETNEEGRQELVDTVAGIKILTQNLVEVTLESGQVWRQMTTKRYPLQVGDSVVIKPTIWGKSYRLTATRVSGFIQVQRVD